ncbi:MAG: hypothetical protein HC846_05585 [Blastocatellia bacterium]|nr:hypothetical protein [Blastocatellia bacterium]
MKKSFILIVIVFSITTSSFSQVALSPAPKLPKQVEQNSNERNSNRERTRNLNFFPFKAKRTKDQDKKLRPSPEDLSKFADFLRKPRTGIFRLMNDVGCDSNVYVIHVDNNCQNAIPGSSFYSFREREYTSAYLSDIRFKDGLLITDGLLSQNILVRLGNVPLEDLSTASEGMKFLVDFVPEIVNTKATRQYIEIVKGIKADRYEYRKVIPATENMTYAMRIIAYRGSFYRSFRGWIFDLISGDDRFDLIVGFRVVRKDEDGSVTILWKELETQKVILS